MSVYRQVHVSFWQDAFVLDLTPEEKYFYIYLMTNSKTSQIGIYELPMRVIEMETGYNRETVEKLLNRFIEYGKVAYNKSTREVFLKNWPKHNWNNSPKVVTRVEKELAEIKHTPFVEEYLTIVDSIKFDTVSIQYAKSMDTKITNKEKEKDNTTVPNPELVEVFDYYISKQIIAHEKFTPRMKTVVRTALRNYGKDVVFQAIDNYAKIFNGNQYFFKQKYTLADLMRPKDIEQFSDEAEPLYNFLRDKGKITNTSTSIIKPSNSVDTSDLLEGMEWD